MLRLGCLVVCAVSATLAAVTPAQVRSASERAIEKLQDSMAVWDQKRDCVSCHHQSLMMIALADAVERGLAVDTTRLQKSFDHAFGFLANPDRAIQGTHDIDLPISEVLGMWAATRLGLPASFTVQANVKRMARRQLPDGHWSTIDMRPPQSFSQIGTTAYAIVELKQLASPMMKTEIDERIERARSWLQGAKPRETSDRTLRMMGLFWAGADVKPIADELLKQQRQDGGWGQLAYLDSDAFSTGDVLTSLAECGAISTSAPQYQSGLRYLLRTQDAATGLWHVKTRLNPPAPVSPEYLETGLPWGHDQFISAMGTARALSALAMALEKSRAGAPLSFEVAAPKQVPDWVGSVMSGARQS